MSNIIWDRTGSTEWRGTVCYVEWARPDGVSIWLPNMLHPDQISPALPDTQKIECPCTTFEQSEECPVATPSMLCSACNGTGNAPIETVVALAAEMMKIAEQVDELEDPFAAWETIELLKSESNRTRSAG